MAVIGLVLLLLLCLLPICITCKRRKKKRKADKEMPPIITQKNFKDDVLVVANPDFSLRYLEYSFGSNNDVVVKGEAEPMEENF